MGKPFKGVFADISEGGLSFYIMTSRPETARMLLSQRAAGVVGFRMPGPARFWRVLLAGGAMAGAGTQHVHPGPTVLEERPFPPAEPVRLV